MWRVGTTFVGENRLCCLYRRRAIVGLKQEFDAAAEDAGERLKGDGCGAVDVFGALLVLLEVADVHAGKGGEFALGKPGGRQWFVESVLAKSKKRLRRVF